MTLPKLVVLGGGGHAKVVLEILKMVGEFDLVGILDQHPSGAMLDGFPILGGDDLLPALRKNGVDHFFVAIGSVGHRSTRRSVYEAVARLMTAARAIHPRATVSPLAAIGAGTAIMAGAVVNPGVALGENVIINTGAIVDHDCAVGDHSHVATGATLCGTVRVGCEAHIGAGATVRQGVSIGDGAVVGAGAVVVRNVAAGDVVFGVPARKRGTREEHDGAR